MNDKSTVYGAKRVAPPDSLTKILLVEDNEDDVALIKLALERARVDCQVDVAIDGIEAMEYMLCEGRYEGREGGLPRLVFLDLDLPRMDGHEFLRRIRELEATRLVPVVVMTVSAEEFDTVTAYDLGANGYIVKPLDGSGFLETVRAAAEYWLKINEGPAGVG